MSEWITLNIGFVDLKQPEINKILKEEYKIHKPSKPNLENIAFKQININEKSLIDFCIKNNLKDFVNGYSKKIYINFYEFNKIKNLIKDKTKEDLINLFAQHSGNFSYFYIKNEHYYKESMANYINNFDALNKFIKDCEVYENFINSHEKTKNYLIKNKEYLDLYNKIKKETCFDTCQYNKPGYLINCENKEDGKIYSFLIGHNSTLPNNYRRLTVIRVKKVLTDEEMNGIHIFD